MSLVYRHQVLLLSLCLLAEFLAEVTGSDLQRLKERRQYPAFLYDAWGKRGASDYTWKRLGVVGNYEIIAIPRLEPDESVFMPKRGAYLDLPWG